jgi:ribosomal protein S18 acetylase RimI-like enzyme
MDDKQELVQTLEELAANAWPAPVQQQLERWRLRAGNNVTRRANSVLAVEAMPVYRGWMDEVTRFYRMRDLPVRFHISDASPAGLEALLDHMGYEVEGRTSMQVAPCEAILDRSAGPDGLEMVAFDHADGRWLDSFIQIESLEESKQETYARILARIGPRRRFVQARLEGQPVAVGMAVAERGWAGLFCVATAKAYRRRGIGVQVMRELARWGSEKGASHIYLQVMLNNRPAVELYEKLGFSHLYGYHYRVLA